MSKRNKGFKASPAPVAEPVVAPEPVVSALAVAALQAADAITAPEQATPEQPIAERRSLLMARQANASNAPVNPSEPQRATLVRPAKGENPERRRVFGYDNGPGGKVPTTARVVVVNAGSLKSAYPGLAEALETTPEASVADLKSAGVAGKSFRRAFRSGLIRFSQD